MSNCQQHAAAQELHENLVEILVQLVPVLNCADLSTLCYACGVDTNELMPSHVGREIPKYLNETEPF